MKIPRPPKPDPQLKYVILRHEAIDSPHFDLMFETTPGSSLQTWRSEVWPIDQDTELVKLSDHRRDYLTYEGPISGDRGHVRRVASGFCLIDRPADDLLRITFRDYVGFFRLEFRQVTAPANSDIERWTARPFA
jgi:hypothetical protein